MKCTTLGTLIDEIESYSEFEAIFIDNSDPITEQSTCVVVSSLFVDPNDFFAIPDALKTLNMVRFLSTGQIMDLDGSLSEVCECSSRSVLIAEISKFHAQILRAEI